MPVTYSINVGTITESSRKENVFSVIQQLPDNTQKLISPKDVRDAFVSAWANSAFKITTLGITANLANELKGPSGAGVTGAVDTLLKVVSSNASVLAYQVDASGSTAQLSVIVERSGWDSDTSLQSVIRALGPVGSAGNIGAYGNVCPSAAAVTSTSGIKIA